MTNDPCPCTVPSRSGFTLIEVIAALVIFSVGVLMVLRLTAALSRQMEYAATSSELVVRAEERLDSLEAVPFDSLVVGSHADMLTIQGVTYVRTAAVSVVTAVLYELQVTLARMDGERGPSLTVTSYSAAPW